MRARLRLLQLEIPVRLGWEEDERRTPQPVWIDVTLYFAALPAAAQTDQLEGTVNYATLAARLTELCGGDEYRLLERLTRVAYDAVRAIVPQDIGVEVSVTKQPVIAGLQGGARFTIADPDSGKLGS